MGSARGPSILNCPEGSSIELFVDDEPYRDTPVGFVASGRERLDDPALGHSAALALASQPVELVAQSLQVGDLALDLAHLSDHERIHLVTGPVRLVGKFEERPQDRKSTRLNSSH